MRIRPRTIFRLLGALVVLLLIVGFGAPFLNADQYAARLRNSLSRALGRQVDLPEGVKFNLFKGPGFSADKVVIHEDPAIGMEPIAYVDSVDVRPSIDRKSTRLNSS